MFLVGKLKGLISGLGKIIKVKTFKNFIFDWSGTLVDDLGPVLDSTNKVFNHFKTLFYKREVFCSEFSLPFKNFYERFLPDISMPELELLITQSF